MKLHDEDKNKAKKVDVILWGVETIGSAERSCDTLEILNQFYSISEKGYSKSYSVILPKIEFKRIRRIP